MLGVDHLAAEVDPVLAKLGSRASCGLGLASSPVTAARELIAAALGSGGDDGGGGSSLGRMKVE
jgi:hypothetical protein